MDPLLRLERAIGVPDAIISAENRTTVAGRLLVGRVQVSFDTSANRESHGWAVDRSLDSLSRATVELIAKVYGQGELDLLLAGDTSLNVTDHLVSREFGSVREAMREQGSDLTWPKREDMKALADEAVRALQAWASARPFDYLGPLDCPA